MARFLFLTWDGGGATVPVRAVAHVLRERGHEVGVLGHSIQAEQFRKAGIPFASYSRSGGFAVTASPLNLLMLMRSRDAARDVADELDACPADLVIADPLLLSTLKELRRRRQRYALLEATTDTLMRGRLRSLGKALWFLGVPVRRVLGSAEIVVTASAAELDPDAGTDAVHIGPMIRAVAARPVSPMILVSLSTFPFPHLAQTWQRLLDATADVPVRVVGTTGPALAPEALRIPQNAELCAWADHTELMREASVVITHGGHGTTIAALAHGIPVLVVPLDASSDQPGIGRAIERAGVGIALPRTALSRRLRSAVERLFGDDDLRRRARELGERIREYGGANAGADALIRSAGEH